MVNHTIDRPTGKTPTATDPQTNAEWLADLIDRATVTLRNGGRLTRRDCLAIARAALRCADHMQPEVAQ